MSNNPRKKQADNMPTRESMRLTEEQLKAINEEGTALRKEVEKRTAVMVKVTADDLKLRAR